MTEELWEKTDGKVQQRIIGELRNLRYIYDHLKAEGFRKIVILDDFGDVEAKPKDWASLVEEVLAVDEVTIDFYKGDSFVSLALVFGNSPDELVCDWTTNTASFSDRLDEIIRHASYTTEHVCGYWPRISMALLKED